MKNIQLLFVFIAFLFGACGENNDEALPVVTDQYAGMTDFYLKNGAPLQTFTVDAGVGGLFVSAKGTRVEIPPDAFVTVSNNPVVGSVTIEFRDIYKKSDMLLSDKPTLSDNGLLLKSAGEFYIKATQNHQALQMADGKKLDIFTPQDTATDGDNAMAAFVLSIPGFDPYNPSSIVGWNPSSTDTVLINASQYVYSLYAFNSDSTYWFNYDDPVFFTSYPQTSLTVHPLDSTEYDMDVFVFFHDVRALVNMYQDYDPDFHFNSAPQGTSCTVVALGVKSGKLYSSFVPTTITPNQTINFSLAETTTEAFKAQLRALD